MNYRILVKMVGKRCLSSEFWIRLLRERLGQVGGGCA